MTKKKQENPWINLIVNVALPMYIMTKLASPDKLGPLNAVLVATAFPLLYGFYDFWKNKHINKISILGLVSVALNGVFTIIQLNPFWFAVKEAAIPALIGVFVLGSVWTKTPLNFYAAKPRHSQCRADQQQDRRVRRTRRIFETAKEQYYRHGCVIFSFSCSELWSCTLYGEK